MGVLPGLKVTGTRLSANLQELHGRTGTRLGSVWTTLIVAQVAVAVAILPAAVYLSWHVVKMQLRGPSIAVERFVVANMALSDERLGRRDGRVRQRQRALMSRLREGPGVRPSRSRRRFPAWARIRRSSSRSRWTSRKRVCSRSPHSASTLTCSRCTASGFWQVAISMRATRKERRAVIVNRTFATDCSPTSSNVLGLRFRYACARPELVRDRRRGGRLPGVSARRQAQRENRRSIIRPRAGDIHPSSCRCVSAVPIPTESPSGSGGSAPRSIRRYSCDASCRCRISTTSCGRCGARSRGPSAVVTLSVLLLSAAGVHAMMSFTIAQRTREIGIRSALGAQPRHLLLGVFGRAMRQLSLGVLAGSILSVVVFVAAGVGAWPASVLLVAVAALMMGVASLAALGPARRSLRLPTVDALRFDG